MPSRISGSLIGYGSGQSSEGAASFRQALETYTRWKQQQEAQRFAKEQQDRQIKAQEKAQDKVNLHGYIQQGIGLASGAAGGAIAGYALPTPETSSIADLNSSTLNDVSLAKPSAIDASGAVAGANAPASLAPPQVPQNFAGPTALSRPTYTPPSAGNRALIGGSLGALGSLSGQNLAGGYFGAIQGAQNNAESARRFGINTALNQEKLGLDVNEAANLRNYRSGTLADRGRRSDIEEGKASDLKRYRSGILTDREQKLAQDQDRMLREADAKKIAAFESQNAMRDLETQKQIGRKEVAGLRPPPRPPTIVQLQGFLDAGIGPDGKPLTPAMSKAIEGNIHQLSSGSARNVMTDDELNQQVRGLDAKINGDPQHSAEWIDQFFSSRGSKMTQQQRDTLERLLQEKYKWRPYSRQFDLESLLK